VKLAFSCGFQDALPRPHKPWQMSKGPIAAESPK
jgi:hypothetical protein